MSNKNFLVVWHFDGESAQLVRVNAASEDQAEAAARAHAERALEGNGEDLDIYIDQVVEESDVVTL